jgi:hypothetical protein
MLDYKGQPRGHQVVLCSLASNDLVAIRSPNERSFFFFSIWRPGGPLGLQVKGHIFFDLETWWPSLQAKGYFLLSFPLGH